MQYKIINLNGNELEGFKAEGLYEFLDPEILEGKTVCFTNFKFRGIPQNDISCVFSKKEDYYVTILPLQNISIKVDSTNVISDDASMGNTPSLYRYSFINSNDEPYVIEIDSPYYFETLASIDNQDELYGDEDLKQKYAKDLYELCKSVADSYITAYTKLISNGHPTWKYGVDMYGVVEPGDYDAAIKGPKSYSLVIYYVTVSGDSYTDGISVKCTATKNADGTYTFTRNKSYFYTSTRKIF